MHGPKGLQHPPVAPLAYGQPPRPATAESTVLMPRERVVRMLATACRTTKWVKKMHAGKLRCMPLLSSEPAATES